MEYKRNHCNTEESYKMFYENQAKNNDSASFGERLDRVKPTSWAVKSMLNLKLPICDVLNIGSQHGRLELILATLWYNVTSIDISQKYLENSKINTAVMNGHIDYHNMAVENVNLLNKKFDIVSCLSVLEHVKDFHVAFDKLLSVAKDGALMLFIVPFEESWLTEEHTRVFNDKNIYEYFPQKSNITTIEFSKRKNDRGWYAIQLIK